MLATRLYNDAAEPRSFEAFVVHMHVAWLYLLHARFNRDEVDIRYPRRDHAGWFVKVDGEHKRWELGKCVAERWTDENDPIRRNLEFFIALRNKIEHRHSGSERTLAEAVSGHAQAMLLNFERELTATFGNDQSLATDLRFPLFVGTFTTDGTAALISLRDRLPAELKKFIADFHSGMTDGVAEDDRFELRLHVILQHSTDPDALAVQFSRWDDMSDEERDAAEVLGKRGQTIVREQTRRVVGHGLLKPREAQERIASALPFVFNSYHFSAAGRIKRIRPKSDDPHPERTDEKYCIYDSLSRSYGYTEAWVAWLTRHCATEDEFKIRTGQHPRLKPAARP